LSNRLEIGEGGVMEHRTIPIQKIKEDYRKGIANDDPYDVIGSLIAGHDALLEALTLLCQESLEDWIYDIREREGLGWNGPRVKAWGQACVKARVTLKSAEERQP